MKTDQALATIQLLGTSIKQLKIENDFIYFRDDDETEKEIDVQYQIEDIVVDEEEHVLLGTILLMIDIQIKRQEEQMKLELAIQGGFTTLKLDEPEKNRESFKKLLSLNGCASLYSIARGIVSSVTSQAFMGETIMLPMINVFKLKEEKEK